MVIQDDTVCRGVKFYILLIRYMEMSVVLG